MKLQIAVHISEKIWPCIASALCTILLCTPCKYLQGSSGCITETSPYKSDPRFPPNILVKMGEILGQNQNDKNGKNSIFFHKIICCGCVLESPCRGNSNTHPKCMILWRTIINVITLVFCENFMSTATFT